MPFTPQKGLSMTDDVIHAPRSTRALPSRRARTWRGNRTIRTARRSLAVAFTVLAGLATAGLGSASAYASPGTNPESCTGVTGHLNDHGATVTAVFDVPTACDEVSVLSWYAAGPEARDPQVLLERYNQENVSAGHYKWKIAAPPPECFRQLDLRVPGRNVDSIVSGEHLCSTTTRPTTASTTTTAAPQAPTTTAQVLSSSVTTPASSTTSTTAAVLGVVITQPAPPAELPRTGSPLNELAGVALIGMGLGLGLLKAGGVQRKRSLRSAAQVLR